MAITWKVTITPVSIATKTASIWAVRTDSMDPDNTRMYDVHRAIIDTSAQKIAVIDEIWAKHQAALSNEAMIDSFVSALETQAKSNLEGREV